MSIEIRSCRDPEEMRRYREIISYVFASTEGVEGEVANTLPEWTTCGWVDGTMAATLGAFPFTMRLNGAPVPAGGVTAVGTLPGYRRQGLLRSIMGQALATMRERDQPLAILWASMGAIYQRFGYGLASTQVQYSFDPRFAAFRDDITAPGRVELLASVEDALPLLKQVYIQWATPRNLCLHRSTALWRSSTLRPRKKDAPVYCAVYRDAAAEPRGHVIYTTEEKPGTEPGPDQVLTVQDFIALDPEAYRGLWDYLRRHDLVRRVEMHGSEDDPIPSLLLEPRMLNTRLGDAIWMRVVDVERALPRRPYGARGELTIAVEGDRMCPWNAGTYLLETDGPTADVRRVDREPDITVSPNVLASLLAGHRSATYFRRAGMLEARNEASLRTADALFRSEYAPHCPNGF
jgi:predicted acetyltransferase